MQCVKTQDRIDGEKAETWAESAAKPAPREGIAFAQDQDAQESPG